MTHYSQKFTLIAPAIYFSVIMISAMPFQGVAVYRTIQCENITWAATRISNFMKVDYMWTGGGQKDCSHKTTLNIKCELRGGGGGPPEPHLIFMVVWGRQSLWRPRGPFFGTCPPHTQTPPPLPPPYALFPPRLCFFAFFFFFF